MSEIRQATGSRVGDGVLFSGEAEIGSIQFMAVTAGTAKVYDGVDALGRLIAVFGAAANTSAPPAIFDPPLRILKGVYVDASQADGITVISAPTPPSSQFPIA